MVVAVCFAFFPSRAFAQGLQSMQENLPSLRQSAAAWGDFNGDGLYDLALTGVSASGAFQGGIYRNEGDTLYFTDDLVPVHETRYSLHLPLEPGVALGALAWGDYDNDGDLDLLVTGRNSGGTPIASLYENRASGLFQRTSHVFVGRFAGSAAWGDFDNDGALDLLLNGIAADGSYGTDLYENVDGMLLLREAALPGIAHGEAVWVDYDGDGDLDVFLAGVQQNQSAVARLYRNDLVAFTAVADLEGLAFASANWADLDADGDPDLVLSGGRWSPFVLDGILVLYRNDGLVLTQLAETRGAYGGTVRAADFQNDGRPDILVSGATHPFQAIDTRPTGSRFGTIYTGVDGMVAPLSVPGLGVVTFGGGFRGRSSVGDYDGDGDADFIVVGERTTGVGFTDVWRNDLSESGFQRNRSPVPPTELTFEASGGSVSLRWHAGTDTETPTPTLTYNVRIGTASGSVDVVSPMSILETGRRLLPGHGNAGHGTSYRIENLPPGRYYWSVQSLDLGCGVSGFAPERAFDVP